MLFATVRQRKIYVKSPQTVVKNGVNVDVLELDMDDEWAEMTSIVCVFSNGTVKKEILHTFGNPITVPWECLAETGVLMLGITGYVGSQKVMTTMNADNGWEIVQNSETTGEEQLEPTQTLTQQLLEAAASAKSAADAANEAKQSILDSVKNGEFNGSDGKDGENGVSVTHEWDGTVLKVTSASGTSSSDLKGDKGDAFTYEDFTEEQLEDLRQGQPGPSGADGTSVTVESVVESAEDGGSNVVTFSDGTIITIKNGRTGNNGEHGKDGQDGVSPSVTVTSISGGHRISITDANGTKTFDVMNGTDGNDGEAGASGADGVGIQSVEQTTTSSADGGSNVITVTKTDGSKSTFIVKNGSKGSQGETGPNEVSTSTTTSMNGIMKGNGSNVAVAVAGTDYVAPANLNTKVNRTTAVNAADTSYTTLMARGEKLLPKADFDAVTDWSEHLVDGAIVWGYE